MHCLSEEPGWPPSLVKRNHRRQSGSEIKQIEHRFHEVVRLYGTSRNVNDRNSRRRFPVPTEIVSQTHASGGIPFHRVNAAIRCTRTNRNDRQSFGSEAVDPFVRGDGLASHGVLPHRGPVTFTTQVLVWD